MGITTKLEVQTIIGKKGGWVGVFEKFFAKKVVALPLPRMD